ncbi:hypothetical protein [Catenuloplanes indicus]|uniref:Uncharacterized protein n=1 Tax=Catenuloplanes indicus TaxID=137267 RepID=A0AAE3W7K9_9ACTN|nr:hypothetical protein [Catenuloplanes indicus]MDQ0370767.1 hypothetical protein [Catenuloplanes indicus]
MTSAYSPVPELNRLMDLQDEVGYGEYADGFSLDDWDDKSGLEAGWSKDPEFLAALIPFARATDGGSFYALWKVDDRADLATLPVVVFGDEGGQHVVARNLRELFRIATFDAEPMVDWDGVTFYRAADDAHRDSHEDFVAWLGEEPVTDPGAIVAAAQAEYGERFAAFTARFLE